MAEAVRPGLEPLPWETKVWRWKVLFATYIAYVGFYLTRKIFTIAKTSIAEDQGWGLDATGYIWAAFLFAYMIGQFVNSFLGRKYGPRVLILGGFGISIVCNTIFGFSNSFYTFMVFMFFNGLVQACGWPGVVGGIAEWLRPLERGSIMGIWSTSYLVGNIAFKAIGGYLLGAYGWHWSFWGMSIISFGIWWIVYFWQRDRPQDVGLPPVVDRDQPDAARTVAAAESEQITFREYLALLFNPFILMMGVCYFCIKFLRYALDSWLPAFLNLQGMGVAEASYYSAIFDNAGVVGVIVAGFALDRVFRGNWPLLCFVLGIGMIGGYLMVIQFGTSPKMLAVCFGLVGFMLYGPDTILAGAAAVQVAGERNAVAVAGIVNGVASLGPVVQEVVIAWLVRDDAMTGMRDSNRLALGMSITFTVLMLFLMWRHRVNQRHYREQIRVQD